MVMAFSHTTPTSTPPKAVLFDAYGTLFDVYSVGMLAEQLFPGQGAAIATLWRDKQIEYTRLLISSTTAGGSTNAPFYKPFWEVTRDALRYACARLGLTLSADAQERLMNQYRALSAFPENKAVLQALQRAGIPTGILSNGDPAMLNVAISSAGLNGLLNHVLSADTVKQYKTHPSVYALGPQALGMAAHDIVFVSSNGWDALGATWYGFQTLWLNRQHLPFETLGPQPTHIANSLNDVLTLFGISSN
jgi:2-haloacid dehalogenase